MNDALHNTFIRYLNDECDEAEISALLLHFQLQEDEVLLKDLILSELENEQKGYIPHDINERLNTIYQRIQQQKQAVKEPVRLYHSRRFIKIAAAAAVLLLAAASYYWLMPGPHSQAPAVTAAATIQPGRNQAILTTSNGTSINLSDATAGALTTEQGMLIQKTADGQISYTGAGSATARADVFNTIQTPAGGQWQVVLPDQTRVWLNASSTLSYPVSFTGKERLVKLTGEAYFEVSPDKLAPFKVLSGNQTVAVLGTAFNIMAYPNEKEIATTLLSGSVQVSAGQQSKTLLPGQQAQLQNQQLQVVNEIDTEQVIAWKNGYFKFNGNIEEVMNQVARWYDVELVYSSKPDAATRFQGEISRTRDLQEVLHIIEYTGKVHFTINNRKITITK